MPARGLRMALAGITLAGMTLAGMTLAILVGVTVAVLVITRPADPARSLPPIAGAFDYQLGGAFTPASSALIVSRDRTDAPAPGVYNICYLNAFQTQPGADWPDSLVLKTAGGERIADPDWPDEYILDTSTGDRRAQIARIVGGWTDDCAEAGFDAVEPDNLDSWQRSDGQLTAADNLALARLIVSRAHERGLAIAQKNAAELSSEGREGIGFDFAITEECEVFEECGLYTAAYGDHVIEVEYTEEAFDAACAARGGEISVLLRDRDVVPRGTDGYLSKTC